MVFRGGLPLRKYLWMDKAERAEKAELLFLTKTYNIFD